MTRLRRHVVASLRRFAAARCRSAHGLAAALLALAGCSYQDPDSATPLSMNTCTPETICGRDSECRDAMCVAKSTDVPLSVVLRIAPVRMPDGSEPQPIVLDRFVVEGPMTRTFELPMPVMVTGYVRAHTARAPSEGLPVEAAVSFTPTELARGLPVAAVMTTTSIAAPDAVVTPDYVVQLLPGVQYRMAVQPTDPMLPPHYRTMMVEDEDEIRVDYEPENEAYTRSYEIVGAPADRPLIVRAFDLTTSELVSSTATVTAGRAVLRFAEEPAPFRLEVQAEESYDDEQQDPEEVWCDNRNAPTFPVFTFQPDEIASVVGAGERIVLPPLPERIRFEGTVALCDAAEQAQSMPVAEDAATLPIDSLPITLHSQQLRDVDGEPLSAAFEATTMATRDEASGELRFCVQVLPGEYDVLATPGANVPCAQFAEHFLISAPAGENASGPLLELPATAYLKGTVQKIDGAPLSQAVVDAVALGRSQGLMLDPDDRSVTRYNRSRQTATGNQGDFALPVDLGSYDVMFKPAASTGFSWQVRHDVAIGKRDEDFRTVIDMHSPIILNGKLAYRRGSTGLEGAEIAAFAVIEDEYDTERAIPIGRAMADAEGDFMLLLPASLHKGW